MGQWAKLCCSIAWKMGLDTAGICGRDLRRRCSNPSCREANYMNSYCKKDMRRVAMLRATTVYVTITTQNAPPARLAARSRSRSSLNEPSDTLNITRVLATSDTTGCHQFTAYHRH